VVQKNICKTTKKSKQPEFDELRVGCSAMAGGRRTDEPAKRKGLWGSCARAYGAEWSDGGGKGCCEKGPARPGQREKKNKTRSRKGRPKQNSITLSESCKAKGGRGQRTEVKKLFRSWSIWVNESKKRGGCIWGKGKERQAWKKTPQACSTR